MKNGYMVKKLVTAAVLSALVISLTACGESEPDPNEGMYKATVAEMSGIQMDVDEVFDGGITIELKGRGKGRFYADGDDCGIKWSLDGDDFYAKGGGAELEGTLKDGVMVLEDLQGSGVNITLVNEDYDGGDSEEMSVLDTLKAYKNNEGIPDTSADTDDDDDWSWDDGDEDDDWTSDDGEDDEYDNHQDTGIYELTYYQDEDDVINGSDLRTYGLASNLYLYSDGTGVWEFEDTSYDLTWEDGVFYMENENGGTDTDYYELDSGILTISDPVNRIDIEFTYVGPAE